MSFKQCRLYYKTWPANILPVFYYSAYFSKPTFSALENHFLPSTNVKINVNHLLWLCMYIQHTLSKFQTHPTITYFTPKLNHPSFLFTSYILILTQWKKKPELFSHKSSKALRFLKKMSPFINCHTNSHVTPTSISHEIFLKLRRSNNSALILRNHSKPPLSPYIYTITLRKLSESSAWQLAEPISISSWQQLFSKKTRVRKWQAKLPRKADLTALSLQRTTTTDRLRYFFKGLPFTPFAQKNKSWARSTAKQQQQNPILPPGILAAGRHAKKRSKTSPKQTFRSPE